MRCPSYVGIFRFEVVEWKHKRLDWMLFTQSFCVSSAPSDSFTTTSFADTSFIQRRAAQEDDLRDTVDDEWEEDTAHNIGKQQAPSKMRFWLEVAKSNRQDRDIGPEDTIEVSPVLDTGEDQGSNKDVCHEYDGQDLQTQMPTCELFMECIMVVVIVP